MKSHNNLAADSADDGIHFNIRAMRVFLGKSEEIFIGAIYLGQHRTMRLRHLPDKMRPNLVIFS